MKKIYKLTLAVFVVVGTCTLAQAQKMDIGVHVRPSLPMGDFSDVYDFGIGGKLFGEYFFNENVHAGIEVGFMSYNREIDLPFVGTTSINTTIMPIEVTGAYHTDAEGEFDFFVGSGVGMFMFGGDAESTTEFGLSPRAGVSLELSDQLRANGSVDYTMILVENTNASFLNVNLGVTYTIFD